MAQRVTAHAKIKFRGPLFNAPRREAILARMKTNILKSLTKFVYNNVMRTLKRRIKKPTPIYWTLIRVDDRLDELWRVTDDGIVVYNHWLEGTGSRNFPVTSFKGYHAFERAAQALEKRGMTLAETQVRKAVKSLGGNKVAEGDGEGGGDSGD